MLLYAVGCGRGGWEGQVQLTDRQGIDFGRDCFRLGRLTAETPIRSPALICLAAKEVSQLPRRGKCRPRSCSECRHSACRTYRPCSFPQRLEPHLRHLGWLRDSRFRAVQRGIADGKEAQPPSWQAPD